MHVARLQHGSDNADFAESRKPEHAALDHLPLSRAALGS